MDLKKENLNIEKMNHLLNQKVKLLQNELAKQQKLKEYSSLSQAHSNRSTSRDKTKEVEDGTAILKFNLSKLESENSELCDQVLQQK